MNGCELDLGETICRVTLKVLSIKTNQLRIRMNRGAYRRSTMSNKLMIPMSVCAGAFVYFVCMCTYSKFNSVADKKQGTDTEFELKEGKWKGMHVRVIS